MIRAGVDVVRLNFSHGTASDHIERAALVRERRPARRHARSPIMADLQGPKIRVGKFEGGRTTARAGPEVHPRRRDTALGTNERVGLDYKELPRDVKPGDTLLLNDGLLRLRVEAVRGEEVHTRVDRRRRAVEQQGHQQGRRRPDRAGADREGHGGHQDRDGVPVRIPRGELPEERDRHGDGAPARQRGRRAVAPQAAADREDRAQRGDPRARADPQGVRRHHGRARRPRGRGRQRGGAGAAEAHDPHGARDGQASSSPRRR